MKTDWTKAVKYEVVWVREHTVKIDAIRTIDWNGATIGVHLDPLPALQHATGSGDCNIHVSEDAHKGSYKVTGLDEAGNVVGVRRYTEEQAWEAE
jgi:hypothetical protein